MHVNSREARLHHPALRRRGARRIRAPLPARRRAPGADSTTSRCSRPARATTSPGRTSTRRARIACRASPCGGSRTRGRATSTRSTSTRTGSSAIRTAAPTRWTWLKQQGPWCPALIEYLRRQHQQYDVLIFFTYLYAPTVLGLEIDASPQRPGVDGARRAGDPARDLQGGLQQTGGALLSHRKRAPVRPACAFRIGRSSRKWSASASICRRASPTRACRRPAPRKSRPRAPTRRLSLAPAPPTRRRRLANFASHLFTRGAVFRRRHRLLRPDRAVRRADRSRARDAKS